MAEVYPVQFAMLKLGTHADDTLVSAGEADTFEEAQEVGAEHFGTTSDNVHAALEDLSSEPCWFVWELLRPDDPAYDPDQTERGQQGGGFGP